MTIRIVILKIILNGLLSYPEYHPDCNSEGHPECHPEFYPKCHPENHPKCHPAYHSHVILNIIQVSKVSKIFGLPTPGIMDWSQSSGSPTLEVRGTPFQLESHDPN